MWRTSQLGHPSCCTQGVALLDHELARQRGRGSFRARARGGSRERQSASRGCPAALQGLAWRSCDAATTQWLSPSGGRDGIDRAACPCRHGGYIIPPRKPVNLWQKQAPAKEVKDRQVRHKPTFMRSRKSMNLGLRVWKLR